MEVYTPSDFQFFSEMWDNTPIKITHQKYSGPRSFKGVKLSQISVIHIGKVKMKIIWGSVGCVKLWQIFMSSGSII